MNLNILYLIYITIKLNISHVGSYLLKENLSPHVNESIKVFD
jgi:hypothetical protein